jgi:hypothetical protein
LTKSKIAEMIYLLAFFILLLVFIVILQARRIKKLNEDLAHYDHDISKYRGDLSIGNLEVEVDLTSAKNSRYKPSKKVAMDIVNNHLGYDALSKLNTNYATLNLELSRWWFDIPPEKFRNELNLILAQEDSFKWVKIPPHVARNPLEKFAMRADKGLIDILISAESGYYYLRDVRSNGTNFNFEPYVQKEFKF